MSAPLFADFLLVIIQFHADRLVEALIRLRRGRSLAPRFGVALAPSFARFAPRSSWFAPTFAGIAVPLRPPLAAASSATTFRLTVVRAAGHRLGGKLLQWRTFVVQQEVVIVVLQGHELGIEDHQILIVVRRRRSIAAFTRWWPAPLVAAGRLAARFLSALCFSAGLATFLEARFLSATFLAANFGAFLATASAATAAATAATAATFPVTFFFPAAFFIAAALGPLAFTLRRASLADDFQPFVRDLQVGFGLVFVVEDRPVLVFFIALPEAEHIDIARLGSANFLERGAIESGGRAREIGFGGAARLGGARCCRRKGLFHRLADRLRRDFQSQAAGDARPVAAGPGGLGPRSRLFAFRLGGARRRRRGGWHRGRRRRRCFGRHRGRRSRLRDGEAKRFQDRIPAGLGSIGHTGVCGGESREKKQADAQYTALGLPCPVASTEDEVASPQRALTGYDESRPASRPALSKLAK
jgi:hypothetical protein